MSDDINLTGLCIAHSFESASALCHRCGLEYCNVCVVYPFGEKKPLCKECAMFTGGVRNFVSREAMSNRDIKRRAKAFRNRQKNGAPTLETPETTEIADPGFNPEELVPTADLNEHFDPAAAHAMAGGEPPAGQEQAIDWNQPFG